jgi:uncharacterized protein YjeT (DUF2065 family)
MWRDLGTALCLMAVIEGLFVFVSPAAWRGMIAQLLVLDDARLRQGALVVMVAGAALLYVVR